MLFNHDDNILGLTVLKKATTSRCHGHTATLNACALRLTRRTSDHITHNSLRVDTLLSVCVFLIIILGPEGPDAEAEYSSEDEDDEDSGLTAAEAANLKASGGQGNFFGDDVSTELVHVCTRVGVCMWSWQVVLRASFAVVLSVFGGYQTQPHFLVLAFVHHIRARSWWSRPCWRSRRLKCFASRRRQVATRKEPGWRTKPGARPACGPESWWWCR